MTEDRQELGTIISCLHKDSARGGYTEMWWQVGDTPPKKQNLFDPGIATIAKANVGKEMLATLWHKDDKYWNIKALVDPLTAPAIPMPANDGSGKKAWAGGARSEDTDKRIAEQVAVKAIAELVCADKLELKNKLGMKMQTWLDNALSGVEIPIFDKDGDNPLKATATQIKAIMKEGDMDKETFDTVCGVDYPWGMTKAEANTWLVRIRKASQDEHDRATDEQQEMEV